MNEHKISTLDVWRSVCAGNTTSPQVGQDLKISRGHAAIYLRVMSEVGLLNRVEGVTNHGHGNSLTFVYSPNYETARTLGW